MSSANKTIQRVDQIDWYEQHLVIDPDNPPLPPEAGAEKTPCGRPSDTCYWNGGGCSGCAIGTTD